MVSVETVREGWYLWRGVVSVERGGICGEGRYLWRQ